MEITPHGMTHDAAYTVTHPPIPSGVLALHRDVVYTYHARQRVNVGSMPCVQVRSTRT